MTDLRIQLPDALAREAQAKGLLDSEQIAQLLRQELRRRAVEQLSVAMDRLAQQPGSAPSPAEIEAEVDAVRSQRRRAG